MSVEVRLPELGESITAAKLTTWLKREGETVKAGEALVEFETDKTTIEVEAPVAGVITQIHVKAGADAVPVGTLLALIEAREVADESRGHRASLEPVSSRVPVIAEPVKAVAGAESIPVEPYAQIERSATPLAARMASLAGVDLARVGHGAGTKVSKVDVERFLGRGPVRPERATLPPPPSALAVNSCAGQVRSLSALRRVTATRMAQAKQTIPHFYLQSDCRADALVQLRARLNALGHSITVTDLLVFIVARAVQRVPDVNATWFDGGVRVFEDVDIGVAVNTPNGLIAPIVRGCQAKRLVAISRELKDRAERARSGTLKPDEYTGGTFTLSNLGMFGVTSITPIINPPHACILGVGAIEERPVVVGRDVAIGRIMSCTLAADHRVIDGATGATFLGELRRLIEDPMSLTIYE